MSADETTRLRALLRESTELALRLSERAERAERERDDLAARVAQEHALGLLGRAHVAPSRLSRTQCLPRL